MKGILKVLVILAVLLGLLFAGLNPVGFCDTVLGMRKAIAGESGTYMYQGNNLLLLGWYRGGRYYFVDVAMKSVETIRYSANLVGQSAAWQEMGPFLTALEKEGFTRVYPGDLDPRIVTALGDYSLLTLVGVAARAMPTLFVIPAGIPVMDEGVGS